MTHAIYPCKHGNDIGCDECDGDARAERLFDRIDNAMTMFGYAVVIFAVIYFGAHLAVYLVNNLQGGHP